MKWKMLSQATLVKNSIKELNNIKKFATKDEVHKLLIAIKSHILGDPYIIRGSNPALCIYGHMTGDCYSSRACELVELCSSSVKAYNTVNIEHSEDYFINHKKRLNSVHYYSQLEVLLFEDKQKVVDLITEIFEEELKTINV